MPSRQPKRLLMSTQLILIGDRVLIFPDQGDRQTSGGLYLPATLREGERVGSGKVVKTGPGYLTPNPEFSETEVWSDTRNAVRFLPLQAQPGDHAFYLKKDAIEVTYQNRTFLIVPHHALLALERPAHFEDADDFSAF